MDGYFHKLNAILNLQGNNMPTLASLKKFVDALSKMGYDGLYFGGAPVFKFAGEPHIGKQRGAYTKEEIKELDEYCKSKNIELMPYVQTLGGMFFCGKFEPYMDFCEGRAILIPDNEQAYAFIDKQFAYMREYFSSNRIHIGLEDVYNMGMIAHWNRHGYEDKASILIRHANRVVDLAKKYGFECEMLADCYLEAELIQKSDTLETVREKAKPILQEGVTLTPRSWRSVDFKNGSIIERPLTSDEFNAALKATTAISENSAYTQTAYSWFGFAPDNANSITAIANGVVSAKKFGVKEMNVELLMRQQGMSIFSLLPTLYFAAECAKGRARNLGDLDKEKFASLFGVAFDDFMKIDLPNKPYKNVKYQKPNNKCFIYLYSDILLGNMDAMVSKGIGKAFGEVAKELESVQAGEFSYIFQSLAALCKVLEKKAELGVALKAAYDEGDKQTILKIADEIPALAKLFEAFSQTLADAWNLENKSFGLEAQHNLTGMVLSRWEMIADILKKYVNGETERVIELEQERLLPEIYAEKPSEDDYLIYSWSLASSNGYVA